MNQETVQKLLDCRQDELISVAYRNKATISELMAAYRLAVKAGLTKGNQIGRVNTINLLVAEKLRKKKNGEVIE